MKYCVTGILHVSVSAEIEANSEAEAKDILIDKAYEDVYTTGDNGIAVNGNKYATISIDGAELSEESVEVEEWKDNG